MTLYFRFLVQTKSTPAPERDAGEGSGTNAVDSKSDDMQPPPAKRVRRRGQNKSRPRPVFIPFSEMLCPSCYHGGDGGGNSCKFGEKCRYTHDIAKYISSKPPDISDECYLFKTYGKCPYGRACRFARSHLTASFEIIVNESLYDPSCPGKTLNVIPRSLQEKLRKRQVSFIRSEAYLKRLKESKKEPNESTGELSTGGMNLEEQKLRTSAGDKDGGIKTDDMDDCGIREGEKQSLSDGQVDDRESSVQERGGGGGVHTCMQTCGPLTDEDIVKLKPAEKKKV